jgi:REP element-mobilizing transposase RayT
MPRRARLAIAEIPWHIIQRGNNRSACFYADGDYLRYARRLNSSVTQPSHAEAQYTSEIIPCHSQ